jgi:hypothetical protein
VVIVAILIVAFVAAIVVMLAIFAGGHG